MTQLPWDQRFARVLVRPLARTPITPNQVTSATLGLAFAAAALLATGDEENMNWGAGLFVLSRFMDHFDGELARLKGMSSRFGYYFDYAAGSLSFTALFVGLGIGLQNSVLGGWSLVLGAMGAAAAVISMILNLGIDKAQSAKTGKEAVGYPAFAGFELEDGIYLLAPITWVGFLVPFFAAAGIGAAVYCLWTLFTLMKAKKG
jgi:phosphatidylglycerophosphate synthase